MSTSIPTSTDQTIEPRDAVAMDDLLGPLLLPAYRLAFGMLRSREEAEDAVQEAAFSAWKHRLTFRPGSDPKPWFFAIVANQCRSFRRNPWSRLLGRANPERVLESSPDLEGDLDLRRAVRNLGHNDRLALILRYYLDLPYEEIAATLGISEQAARSRTQRGVRRLRAHLRAGKELT